MGELLIFLSELVEGTHLAGTALHLFASLALGELSHSWQGAGEVCVQLGPSCPHCLPLGRLLLCSSAGRASPLPLVCASGHGVVWGSPGSSWQRPCEAAGAVLQAGYY